MSTLLWSLVITGSAAFATLPPTTARGDASSSSDPSGPAPSWPNLSGPKLRPGTPTPKVIQAATSDANDIVQLVDESLSGITLRDDQSTALQKLGNEIDAKVGTVDQARRDGVLILARQIQAGTIDRAAVRPDTQEILRAAAAASVDLRGGFEKMHDILDADQRKLFVSRFREAVDERASMIDAKTQIEEWSNALELSDQQKEKLGAIFADDTVPNDVERARADLVLAAFLGDEFSPDELLPAGSVTARTQEMLDHIIDVTDRVTQMLTPAQRKTAAEAIEAKASASSPGGSDTGTTIVGQDVLTATIAEGLWVGRGEYHAAAYRRTGAYGFSRAYASGFGGFYLF